MFVIMQQKRDAMRPVNTGIMFLLCSFSPFDEAKERKHTMQSK
jgi:hypothetical protein